MKKNSNLCWLWCHTRERERERVREKENIFSTTSLSHFRSMNLISTELADDTLELYLKRFAYVALINSYNCCCWEYFLSLSLSLFLSLSPSFSCDITINTDLNSFSFVFLFYYFRIINSVVLFVILVCGSQLSHGVKLDCEFIDVNHYLVGKLYSCCVSSFDNPINNLSIDGYYGEHEANKNDADVKGILFRGTNTKYIPTNLGTLFNLTALSMENTQLVEIKAEDFHGMQDLESISFWDNKLSSVPLGAFATLTKLRFISLSF